MKRVSLLASSLALVVLLVSSAAHSATYSINNMNIAGGGLLVDGFLPTVTPFNYIGSNTNLVGGYIGSGGSAVVASNPNPVQIVGLDWYGMPLGLYTAAANLGDATSPAGTMAGGPVASGTLDDAAGTITLDLRSLFGNWNDGDYITGTGRADGITSVFASGTWDPVTHTYNLHWDSNTIGPFCGSGTCVSHWTLQGTASPVPVPAAIWLFGSGLLGLTGIRSRRRK